MRTRRLPLLLLILLFAAGCGQAPPDERVAAEEAAATLRAQLSEGWNEIRPGGATVCSLGTEFAFFARPASTERLVVYLQGGGACWNARTCDPEGDPTYSRDVGPADNPANRPVGIFDLDHPDNPVSDRSMVMIPYCTGDVHVGDALATYTVTEEDNSEREIEIHHRGYVNVMAALDWVLARYPRAEEILVTGSSAGSIPSPFYAQRLAERYPEASITALGDASGSYRRDEDGDDPSLSWKMHEVVGRHPGYEDAGPGTVGFEDFYIVAGRRHPDLRLLQFDAANDQVQEFYVGLSSEDPEPVRELIAANRADIRAELPDFRAYLAGGPEHTILWRPAFYSYEVRGLLFRDWLAAALEGEPVPDVQCDRCERPEIHLAAREIEVLERARELLASEADWSRQDDGRCPSEGALSLRCALLAATAEIDGRPNPDAAALLEARYEARARLGEAAPERGDPLRAFNAGADFADIRELLEAARASAMGHRHE